MGVYTLFNPGIYIHLFFNFHKKKEGKLYPVLIYNSPVYEWNVVYLDFFFCELPVWGLNHFFCWTVFFLTAGSKVLFCDPHLFQDSPLLSFSPLGNSSGLGCNPLAVFGQVKLNVGFACLKTPLRILFFASEVTHALCGLPTAVHTYVCSSDLLVYLAQPAHYHLAWCLGTYLVL